MLTVMRIERWDPRRDGPVTEAALRRKLEAIGYQVSRRSWPARTVLPPQAQDQERIQAVITGIMKITIDGEAAILTAGDLVHVPRGTVRTVQVVGATGAHCLDAVYCGVSAAGTVSSGRPQTQAAWVN